MSKTKEGAAECAIREYLDRQNRPYSANDIFNNLHKEFGKALVVKSLEVLAEQNKICEKTYGKQKVYLAEQSQFPAINEAELQEMDMRIKGLTESIQEARVSLRQQETDLKKVTGSMTTEKAQGCLREITTECDTFRKRLERLKNAANSVSPEERNKIVSERTRYVKEWRKRKRMTSSILDAILEGYPKKKRDLQEEMGIETDEDLNIIPLE